MRRRYRALYGRLSPEEQEMWREVNEGTAPACFDSQEQWDHYRGAARMEPPLQASYCQDCTLAYKTKMQAQGRCAHPEVEFDEDGEGRRGAPARRKEKAA